MLPPGRVLGVIADRPLHRPQLAQIALAARTIAGHLLVLVPTAGTTPDGLSCEGLVRTVLAARDRMPSATIVTVPLAPHGDEIRDALLETGERTVTVLDGDIVRRELSAGLTFSKADRDLNIRRIGWVAAEVARHGGLAICCPIAPYAAARAQARELARAAGAGFALVWVATPLSLCESRDRKGVYARARAGLLKGMTGTDDPYEEPADADLVLDTSELPVADAVTQVLDHLAGAGWIDPRRAT